MLYPRDDAAPTAGEYVECLGPVLSEQGVEVTVEALRRYANEPRQLYDVLDMTCAMLAHRRCVRR